MYAGFDTPLERSTLPFASSPPRTVIRKYASGYSKWFSETKTKSLSIRFLITLTLSSVIVFFLSFGLVENTIHHRPGTEGSYIQSTKKLLADQ